jgi:hypothetical protein
MVRGCVDSGGGAVEHDVAIHAVRSARRDDEYMQRRNAAGAAQVVLKWDSHFTYTVTNAACAGGTATLTINPAIPGPNGTRVVPYFVKAVIAGVSDTHYNTTASISGWGLPNNNTVSYGVVGRTCSGVGTGNLGGTVSLVPGKAVKNHLIYRCTGGSCTLPANAANYSMIGVAQGNDGYFVDNGISPTLSAVDLGDAPSTPPSAAANQYLSTTIASGGGTTTLTLGASAMTSVSGAKVFHDNTPNLLAACAAFPQILGSRNAGHLIIPAPTGLGGQGAAMFPIEANFDTYGKSGLGTLRTCPGVTLDFRAQPWMRGAILVGNGVNIISDSGAGGCSAPFYGMGTSLTCVYGYSYPMLYFEPEQSSNNYFQNLVFAANQPYQSAFFYDQQMNGDGVVSQRYDNVHVTGNIGAPIIDKGGFGRFWNYGGWSQGATNFALSRSYTFTQNCGAPTYTVNSPNLGTYITETHGTYNFGTATVDGCGQSVGNWVAATFNNMLGEGLYGPAWLFNTFPYGLSSVTFSQSSYSDFNGGYSTPFYDLTNSYSAGGVRFQDNACGTGFQTLFETSTSASSYTGVNISAAGVAGCGFLGIQNYRYENMGNSLTVESNYNRELLGNSQVYTPMGPPANFQSVTQLGAGNVPVGAYTYCLTAVDALGGETASTPGACTQITVAGSASMVQMVMPATFPAFGRSRRIYQWATCERECLREATIYEGGGHVHLQLQLRVRAITTGGDDSDIVGGLGK